MPDETSLPRQLLAAISSSSQAEVAAGAVLNVLCEHLGLRAAAAVLHDPETPTRPIVVFRGPTTSGAIRGTLFRDPARRMRGPTETSRPTHPLDTLPAFLQPWEEFPLQEEGHQLGLVALSAPAGRPLPTPARDWSQAAAKALSHLLHNAYHSAQVRKTCSDLRALLDAMLAVLDCTAVDEALPVLADHAREVIGADVVCAALVDEEAKQAHIRATAGTRTAALDGLIVPLSCLRVNQPTDGNRSEALDIGALAVEFPPLARSLGVEGCRSAAVVPLALRDNQMGILLAASRSQRGLTEQSISLLGQLARAASAALEKSVALERVQATQASLLETRSAFQRAARLQRELERVLASRASVPEIVTTLARVLDRPARLLDQFGNVIASPQSTSPDQGSQERGGEGEYGQGGSLLPIIVGGETLAHLWLGEPRSAREEADLAPGQLGAMALAAALLRERRTREVQSQLRVELLHDLVNGRTSDVEALAMRASYLGLNLHEPHAILVIEFGQPPGIAQGTAEAPAPSSEVIAELTTVAREACSGFSPAVDVYWEGDHAILIFSTSEREDARRAAQTIVAAARDRLLEWPISIGIGRLCNSPSDYALSDGEARHALAIARSLGQVGRVMDYQDLEIYALLSPGDQLPRLVAFSNQVLDPLLQHDARKGSELLTTLETFLLEDCNVGRTARRLFLHPNTIRYRLERIASLAALDLADPEVRFQTQLALRILRVSQRLG